MDLLDAMRSFVRVAEVGSFSGAARDQNMTQSAISKQVAWLEGQLGVRLLQRTTRSVSLTEEGQTYAEHAATALSAVAAAQAAVAPRRQPG